MDIIGHLFQNLTLCQGKNLTANSIAAEVIRVISFVLGLPGVCFSIYLMGRQVNKGKAAPVYLISLLASDIFSIFGQPNKPVDSIKEITSLAEVPSLVFYFGVITNIVFMVCVAQERYLLVASSKHSACCLKVKQSAMVSMAVWAAPCAILLLAMNGYMLFFSIALLIPFVFLLFYFVDTFRALWCTRSSRHISERKRILSMQSILLFNYSFLYLPFILNTLFSALSLTCYTQYLELIANALLRLGPLVDPFLSFFMTKGIKDIVEAFSCCRKKSMPSGEPTVETVSEHVTRL